MGGSNSCFRSGESDEKTIKGTRPNDYTEISDDFLIPEKSAVSENGHAKADGEAEDLYVNNSSIIRASNIGLQEAQDKSNVKQTSGGTTLEQPLAGITKHDVAPSTNGKKPKPQRVPPPPEKARKVKPANEGGEVPSEVPAFGLSNPSEVGRYQNVQPVWLKKPKPPPKVAKPETGEEEGNIYAKVQKPKPQGLNGNSQQLNYIEVEFLQSPENENKIQINTKNDQQAPTTYTDVIHKDGKIMLVSPSS